MREIKTDRLLLRAFRESDYDDLQGEQRLYAENTGVTDFLYYEKIPEFDLFKEG